MIAMKPELVERELTSEGPVRCGAGGNARQRRLRSVTINLSESPLSWLHARGHLDDRLFAAGECLHRDFEKAGIQGGVTMSWDGVRVDGASSAPLSPTERQLAARDRFDGAITAAGKGLSDILWRVVCGGESLPVAEKQLSWPIRSGKLVLRIALDRVADFYGLP